MLTVSFVPYVFLLLFFIWQSSVKTLTVTVIFFLPWWNVYVWGVGGGGEEEGEKCDLNVF